jgi:PAS domain S-box-containing protein
MAVSGTSDPYSEKKPRDGLWAPGAGAWPTIARSALPVAMGAAGVGMAIFAIAQRLRRPPDRRRTELAVRAAGLERRVRDRTAELDEAHRALAESEARLRAIFDSTFQMTGLATIDGIAVAVNRAALAAVRADETDVIGKYMWDTPWWAQSPGERERLLKSVERVRAGEFVRYEGTIQLAEGPRTFDFSMRPLYLHRLDRPDHILVEGRDLTELKAAKERAERSQKMEALGLLTGGVAHDFNNILTVIKGAIEMSLKSPAEPRSAQLLRAAMEAAQRGEELNKQLLGFARRKPVTQVSLEIADTVTHMAPLLRNAVGAARRLELDLEPLGSVCVVEASQFETALLNLVVNARDATPEGGVVTVRLRRPRARDLHRFAPLGHDFVCVEVADTGEGIAPENLGRVFDPFFTTKPPGRGTGLGLSQVYGFVQQSAGLLDLQSTPGQGTCLTLALPINCAAQAVRTEPRAFTPSSRRLEILLVEDDPLVSEVSEAMLRRLDHQVTSVRTARQAMEVLETGRFDLLLTDVVMPEGVNGVQLARVAKAKDPGLSVLLCSGWTADALDEAKVDQSPWPLLHKPFGSDELERAIAEAARR